MLHDLLNRVSVEGLTRGLARPQIPKHLFVLRGDPVAIHRLSVPSDLLPKPLMMLLTAPQHNRSNLRPHQPQRLRPSPPIQPRGLLSRQRHLQTIFQLRQLHHQTLSNFRPPRRTLPPLHHQREQQYRTNQRKPNPLPRRRR